MMNRQRSKMIGAVSRPTPTVKVWPVSGNETLAHPVSGPLRPGPGGTSWAQDAFTTRRLAAGEITTTGPGGDIGRQREAIIEQKIKTEGEH